MSAKLLATSKFLRDVDSLQKSKRKQVYKIPEEIDRLREEKLRFRVGGSSVYSYRINNDYRMIWTEERHPDYLLRLVGAHDPVYREAERLKPFPGRKAASFSEFLPRNKPVASTAPVHPGIAIAAAAEPERRQPDHGANTPEQDGEDLFPISGEDLEKLLRGEIASWMIFLPPEHREFVTRRFNGPARVSGPSGSGKTVLLLHRAFHEAKRDESAKILVVCYNIGLSTILSELLNRLCASDPSVRSRIDVQHLDGIASELCGRPRVMGKLQRQELLEAAVVRASAERLKRYQDRYSEGFIGDEISQWLKDDPATTPDTYRNMASRDPHVPPEVREEILRVFHFYESSKGDLIDWEDLRSRALSFAVENPSNPYSGYSSILVDEYQDLSVSGMKLIMELSRSSKQNVFFCGDERQRIYRSTSSFRQLGIEIRGRSIVLGVTYRNTRQICRIAEHFAKTLHGDEAEGAVPPSKVVYPNWEGPVPVLAGFRNEADEINWIANTIHTLLKDDCLPGDIGVLAPSWDLRDRISEKLSKCEIKNFILEPNTAPDFFDTESVKVSTYHQAKGLEYKIVFCSGLSSEIFRKQSQFQTPERRNKLDSLLYMGITRARDRLFMSFTGQPLRWLCELCDLQDLPVELQCDAEVLIIEGQDILKKRKNSADGQLRLF